MKIKVSDISRQDADKMMDVFKQLYPDMVTSWIRTNIYITIDPDTCVNPFSIELNSRNPEGINSQKSGQNALSAMELETEKD